MPGFHHIEKKQEGKERGKQGHSRVSRDNDCLAVPSIHQKGGREIVDSCTFGKLNYPAPLSVFSYFDVGGIFRNEGTE